MTVTPDNVARSGKKVRCANEYDNIVLSRRRLLAAGAASVAVPFVTRSAQAQVKQKIVVAQPSSGFNYLPVYVAQGLGLFQKEGLDVELIVFEKGASSALTAVIGGDATLYVGLPAIPLQARAKGQRTTIFAGLYNQWGSDIVLQPDAAAKAGIHASMTPERKAASLRGLKIAVAGAGSITDLLVRHVARFGGLDTERDLTIIPIGGGSNMLAAFAQKKIDGYCLTSPTSTVGVITMAGVSLFDFAKGEYPPLRDFLYTGVSARDEWVTRNEDTASRIVRALWRAQIEMRANEGAAKAAIVEFFPRTEPLIVGRAWENILPGFGQTLAVNPEGVKRNIDFLREARGEAIAAPVEETSTNRIVDAVKQTL